MNQYFEIENKFFSGDGNNQSEQDTKQDIFEIVGLFNTEDNQIYASELDSQGNPTNNIDNLKKVESGKKIMLIGKGSGNGIRVVSGGNTLYVFQPVYCTSSDGVLQGEAYFQYDNTQSEAIASLNIFQINLETGVCTISQPS